MIIKLNPHTFLIFLTIAMGMAYAISHSRVRWGFWKLAIIGIVVIPFVYMGTVRGHIIEICIGLFVGWLYGRGGFRLPSIHPLQGLKNRLANRKAERARKEEEKRQEKAKAKPKTRKSSYYKEEQRRRSEQARKKREQAKAKQKRSQDNAERSRQREKTNSRTEQSPPERPATKPDYRTPYDILGVSEGATQAQIKKAYSMQRSRYHPDKYEHMSDNFKQEAAVEFRKVQKAWKDLNSRNS